MLSPARADLADGTRVSVAAASPKLSGEVPADPAPATSPIAERTPAAVVTNSASGDDAVISAAITAHVDSVVNDARRNVGKYSAAR